MTSPAQVRALFCALYAVSEETGLNIHLIPTSRPEVVSVSIAALGGQRHRVEVSAHNPNPLAALREDLAVKIVERIARDLTALVPHMASVPALAPLVQVGLMLRLGRGRRRGSDGLRRLAGRLIHCAQHGVLDLETSCTGKPCCRERELRTPDALSF